MKKQYKINSFENPWVRFTILLGIVIALLIAYQYYHESVLKDQKEQMVLNFLEFAQENKFSELCNIEQSVCCNTRTGECKYIEKEEN